MAIVYKKSVALLEDTVAIEDAEGLQTWLREHPKAKINVAACTHLHAAVLQVMMAARVVVSAWPREARLKAWLTAALNA